MVDHFGDHVLEAHPSSPPERILQRLWLTHERRRRTVLLEACELRPIKPDALKGNLQKIAN